MILYSKRTLVERDVRGKFRTKRTTPIVLEQVNEYLRWCEFNRRMTPATMRSKRQSILKFVSEHKHLNDLRELTNRELDEWVAQMIEAGRAGKTVNNYVDHVTACLRYLQNQRGEHLHVRLEALLRIDEDENDLPYFTPPEIAKIKDQCKSLREILLVSLIFESALRINEVANLTVENIEDKHIRLRGKGRKLRDSFILQPTRELLDRWLLLTGISEGLVFPSPTKFDAPLSAQQIRWSINSPIRRAGFKEGSAHSLRRSAITAALRGGMFIQDAAKWAGHSDPKVTLRHYYRITPQELGDKHEQAFNNILNNKS